MVSFYKDNHCTEATWLTTKWHNNPNRSDNPLTTGNQRTSWMVSGFRNQHLCRHALVLGTHSRGNITYYITSIFVNKRLRWYKMPNKIIVMVSQVSSLSILIKSNLRICRTRFWSICERKQRITDIQNIQLEAFSFYRKFAPIKPRFPLPAVDWRVDSSIFRSLRFMNFAWNKRNPHMTTLRLYAFHQKSVEIFLHQWHS